MNAMPPVRRTIKNIVHNYTDCQVKVREATSNDPWGPSSTLMTEIADLTYNVVAFTEIMQMIWKRLNDHGKNWRHVYKALVLLEYLIKTGTEKVAQQCKENIFAIQTLKDFQYIEENKDQGMNVREKAKLLVSLLKDDERLKNERARALKAKERFAQNSSGIGSSTVAFGKGAGSQPDSGRMIHDDYGSPSSSPTHQPGEGGDGSELEAARPQTTGEEELQLQLALAMSREEAEQSERVKKGDDIRLQMALSESSSHDDKSPPQQQKLGLPKQQQQQKRAATQDSLMDIDFGAAGGGASAAAPRSDPWDGGATAQVPPPPDPWSSSSGERSAEGAAGGDSARDPWAPPPKPVAAAGGDPWSTAGQQKGANGELDEFDLIGNRAQQQLMGNAPGDELLTEEERETKKKTPETFLGENKNLVNLDSLISKPSTDSTNPFATTLTQNKNPFQNAPKPSVPMNQLRTTPNSYESNPTNPASQQEEQGYNPFL